MKKLMFVAAVAAGMVAFGDAIESANVVGYNTKTSNAGFTFYVPQFKDVGSNSGVNIQNIKLGDGATSWADNLQIMDDDSVAQTMYVYATADESGFDEDGWVNEEVTDLADVVLTPGQSVLIATSAEISILNSGEVATANTVVSSVAGFNSLGNNSPSPINIQDVKLGAGATSWNDNIQFLDTDSVAQTMYVYATADESGFDEDGWVNEDVTDLADVTIQPGEGFLVATANSGVSITLPAAL